MKKMCIVVIMIVISSTFTIASNANDERVIAALPDSSLNKINLIDYGYTDDPEEGYYYFDPSVFYISVFNKSEWNIETITFDIQVFELEYDAPRLKAYSLLDSVYETQMDLIVAFRKLFSPAYDDVQDSALYNRLTKKYPLFEKVVRENDNFTDKFDPDLFLAQNADYSTQYFARIARSLVEIDHLVSEKTLNQRLSKSGLSATVKLRTKRQLRCESAGEMLGSPYSATKYSGKQPAPILIEKYLYIASVNSATGSWVGDRSKE